MMRIYDNGVYRDATPEEEAAMTVEQADENNTVDNPT